MGLIRNSEGEGVVLEIAGGRECWGVSNVTPEEARQVARWLVEAADMADRLNQATAS